MAQEQITTVEALTAAYPELVAGIKRDERKAGVEEGTKAERARAESLMSLSAHVTDIGVIAEGIKGGKTKEAVMTEIFDAQAEAKAKADKDAQNALEAAAKESAKNVVAQGTLADDGLVADEEQTKKTIDAMAKNLEGAK